MNTIVLAQGQGMRWDYSRIPAAGEALGVIEGKTLYWMGPRPEYKQLIPIGSETLIGRTMRMLGEAGLMNLPNRTILVAWPDFHGRIPDGLFSKIVLSDNGTTIFEGTLAARGLWGDDATAILCGDVIFSRKCIDHIAEWQIRESPLEFITRTSGPSPVTGKQALEILGLLFRPSALPMMESHIKGVVDWAKATDQPGRMWHFYNGLGGNPYSYNYARAHYPAITWEPGDYTDDVDSPQEWALHGELLLKAVEADK
jgi:hypothetical protein